MSKQGHESFPNSIGRVRFLVVVGSIISIGFGIWHFFIPGIWDWYAYIDADATELALAVRAINFFFALLLVLLGLANLLLMFRRGGDHYALILLLSISALLWATRIVFQLKYPQGSEIPGMEYGMLLVFIVTFFCFALPISRIGKKMRSL